MPQANIPRTELDMIRHRRERSRSIRMGDWFQRGASVMLDQADRSARTIPAVVATESPIPIMDRQTGRVMDEVLIASGGRLPEWAPMLRSHETYDLVWSTLGSVLNSRRVDQTIQALLSFAQPVGESDEVERVWTRVRDGHLRGVSVGGRRLVFTDIEPGQSATVVGRRWVAGKRPLRITTSWVMREASIVIFGADSDAGTR